MTEKNTVAIFGSGQIGTAAHELLKSIIRFSQINDPSLSPRLQAFKNLETVLIANAPTVDGRPVDLHLDVEAATGADISAALTELRATHVINALPFFLNVKLAAAALQAGCSYFDFTEDDEASDQVQRLYHQRPDLTCATKCGLAPGFINYVGLDLVRRIDKPGALLVSVGALPRHVSYSAREPWKSYNLSWSVDGLVNEYIRPCRVKLNGRETTVPALSGRETLMIDGTTYELANTSGGVGSLTKDLSNVPNVCYKTIRYPGHYDYVAEVVKRHHGNFAGIKAEFQRLFPLNKDDVIVVYSEATGADAAGNFVRKTFSDKYYGAHGLSAIQVTTAAGALGVLELSLLGKVGGKVTHSDVKLADFRETLTFDLTYNGRY